MGNDFNIWQHWAIMLLWTTVLITSSQSRQITSSDVKRQWLFQCDGWGPGCMKTSAAKIIPFSQTNYKPVNRQGEIIPGFILTSGNSWGAIGKRDSTEGHLARRESFRQLLLHVLLSKTSFLYKELLYKEMLRRFLRRRMRERPEDIPQLA